MTTRRTVLTAKFAYSLVNKNSNWNEQSDNVRYAWYHAAEIWIKAQGMAELEMKPLRIATDEAGARAKRKPRAK